jgi:hypothetical protein
MQWPALLKWNSKYLSEVMTGQSVSVAMTPLGCVTLLHWSPCEKRHQLT